MKADAAVERLRRLLVAAADRAASSPSCPPAEALWAAAGGELTVEERRRLVDHTASCPACARDWRLAVAVAGELRRASRRRWLRRGLGVAATVLVAIGLSSYLPAPSASRPPVYRTVQGAGEGLVVDDQQASRDDCVLQWSGPPGLAYDLIVLDSDLRLVASARGLEEPRFRVPAERLAGLPPGSLLYARVVVPASSPGRRLASQTFTIRID
ncbi:MAG: zf-HC2 domain-containing protein [Acidobacteria bacterium]|nr:MAG: zf-HC2 domain-containing protein [Acidobacteriota bacterium]